MHPELAVESTLVRQAKNTGVSAVFEETLQLFTATASCYM